MSYQHQRAGKVTGPDLVSRVFVVIPGCSHGPMDSCPLDDFKALVVGQIDTACVSTVDPAFMETANPLAAEVVISPLALVGIVILALFVGAGGAGIAQLCIHGRFARKVGQSEHEPLVPESV